MFRGKLQNQISSGSLPFSHTHGVQQTTWKRGQLVRDVPISDSLNLPTKPLVSYRTYRQLSVWNPPPLVIRAFRAHCQKRTLGFFISFNGYDHFAFVSAFAKSLNGLWGFVQCVEAIDYRFDFTGLVEVIDILQILVWF